VPRVKEQGGGGGKSDKGQSEEINRLSLHQKAEGHSDLVGPALELTLYPDQSPRAGQP
jgi:hypothetical protein